MYRYLIIDDEMLIRKGTIKKLKPLEPQVICCGEAENGEEGIRMARELQPDIIILDMQMPVMDGMQLLPWMAEHFPGVPLIVISGFQNFDYMKQAISSKAVDYILKPFGKEEIQKTVMNAVEALQNKESQEQQILSMQEEKEEACYALDRKLLYNLIMGYDTEDATISSERLYFINQAHNLVLLTVYSVSGDEIPSMQENLEKTGFADLVLYLPHTFIRQSGFWILFLPEYEAESAKSARLLKQFLDTLRTKMEDSPFLVGISDVHRDIQELHRAYLETTEALNCQKVGKEMAGEFFYSETGPPMDIQWEGEEEFLFRIESGQMELVKKMAEELFDWYSGIPDCTLADVKRHCEHVGGRCRQIMSRYLGQKKEQSASPEMQAVVNTLFTLKDVENYYLQFYLNIAHLLRPHSIYNTGELIDQIQTYMKKNYQKSITQDFLASLFFLNRSYLSQLFRKKTGQKFIDYLNEIRIEKAKEQLISTDKKMYQIARSVGYDNVKYFFRIFRKKTGFSPEQFREEQKSRKFE
ncbi:MAG TPA: response regulator [Candidatus Pullilachnospira intestinigallinarum]|nr:response regulator [Candidatus Pullilachnospira intestinigallinarum]